MTNLVIILCLSLAAFYIASFVLWAVAEIYHIRHQTRAMRQLKESLDYLRRTR